MPQGKKSAICGGIASEHNTHAQRIQMPVMAPLGHTPPARFKASVCLTHLVAIHHTAPFGAITLCVLRDLFPLTFICNTISLSLSHSLSCLHSPFPPVYISCPRPCSDGTSPLFTLSYYSICLILTRPLLQPPQHFILHLCLT